MRNFSLPKGKTEVETDDYLTTLHEGRDHVGIDGIVILKSILKRQDVRVGIEFTCLKVTTAGEMACSTR
jgi:hypothetical protein